MTAARKLPEPASPTLEMPAKPAIYAELLALPDHVNGEIVAGDLYASPRPRFSHARVSSRLGRKLGPFDEDDGSGLGGWILLFEPELHLGGDVLIPDLAGWRRSTMPELPEVAFTDVAPDWVCEVLSPSTARLDRGKKLAAYAREGVSHVWLIDPDAKTLEIFERLTSTDGPPSTTARYVLSAVHGDDDVVNAAPFAALPLELAALWAR